MIDNDTPIEIDWSTATFRYMRWRQSIKTNLWAIDAAWYHLIGFLVYPKGIADLASASS